MGGKQRAKHKASVASRPSLALAALLLITVLAPASYSALPPSGALVASSSVPTPLAASPARLVVTLTDDSSAGIYQNGAGIELAQFDPSGGLISSPVQVSASTDTGAVAIGPAGSLLLGARETGALVVRKIAISSASPLSATTLDTQGVFPSLASSDTEYAAVWLHLASGSTEVRVATSPDGASWSSAQSVAAASASARAGVVYSASGLVVGIADAGQLNIYRKSGASFLPPEDLGGISSPAFSLIGQPLAVAFETNQGVMVASDTGAGLASAKVAPNSESQSSLGVTRYGLALLTASSDGVIRRNLQGGTWSAPIIEIAQPGSFSPQVAAASGHNRAGALWATREDAGSQIQAAALDVSPPAAKWEYPAEHSVIGGVVPLTVTVTDDVGVATTPSYFIVPESAPTGELGTNIDDIHGRPGWVPGQPPTHPPPGAGGGGGGQGQPPATLQPAPPPAPISSPGQPVTYQRQFDTRQVPDGEYRFTATAFDTSLNPMLSVLDPIIDNTSPTVGIDLPATDTEVTSSVAVTGTVTDTTLASWQLTAETTSTAPVIIATGTTPVASNLLGTFQTSMLPAAYSGYVYLVLSAADSVTPTPNTASYTRRVQADDLRDAFGFLKTSPTYEISATVPILADVTGQVASWRLDAFRAGETTPGITPPSYTNTGTNSGLGITVGSWDAKNKWGPGTVTFQLTTTDTTGGDTFVDTKAATFIWRPMEVSITAPFLDGALPGVIEVTGTISGSNTWAWAIGTPISDTNPAFSPDGRRVAFESSRETFGKDIWVVATDGSGLTRLTGAMTPSISSGFNGSPSFSPDGLEIVFYSTRDGNNEIYVMNDDGSDPRNLTNNSAQDFFPAISPDGTKIAFVSDRSGHDAIWMMDVDGSNQTLVADVAGQAQFPDFSPDGKRIVFDAGPRGSQQIYFVYLTDTANPIQLTTGFGSNPDYSPDGTRIAFECNVVFQHNADICVMGADGTNITQFTQTSAGEIDAAFAPDFAKLAFASFQSGSLEIYIMDANSPLGPATPLTSQSSIFGIHDRLPDFSPLRYPFPPAPTANMATKIDTASFVEGSYRFTPPNQFPTGERPSNQLLGHIDTTRLKPGINTIELVALQCLTPPPPFVFRVPRQFDQETSDTITALAGCTAHTFRQTIRVAVASANTRISFTANEVGPGFQGPLAVTDTFYSKGSWNAPDRWSLKVDPEHPDRAPSPVLIRTIGWMWAKGSPASDGGSFVPVGDPVAIENLSALMDQPEQGLAALAGQPPVVYPAEQFAYGRSGPRYEVTLTAPPHFGGTKRIIAWQDGTTGFLGALEYSYADSISGPYTDMPVLGAPWGPQKGTQEAYGVRIVFSDYARGDRVAKVAEAGE